MLEVQLAYLIHFSQFFLTVCFVFYFWHTILVLNDIGNTFLENVFLVLVQVPTTAYLMAQHKSYEQELVSL